MRSEIFVRLDKIVRVTDRKTGIFWLEFYEFLQGQFAPIDNLLLIAYFGIHDYVCPFCAGSNCQCEFEHPDFFAHFDLITQKMEESIDNIKFVNLNWSRVGKNQPYHPNAKKPTKKHVRI